MLKRATAAAQEFETSFWSGVDLNSLYRDMARADATPQGMAGIFEAGFREFGKLKQSSLGPEQVIEGSRRAMRVSQLREMDRLEHNLAFLATVSNTSPYIGLLGTVWGIMSSFQALGGMQSATICVVAPVHLRSALRDGDGPHRGDPGRHLLQPLRGSGRPPRGALRHVHGRAVGDLPAQRRAARRAEPRRGPRQRATSSRSSRHEHEQEQSKGKRRLMSEINVVPYIDVMLVLLIIFMITAPLLTQGISVDLPNAPAQQLDPELLKDNEPLVLSVDREGQFYLNIGDDEDQPIDDATVVERASAVLRRNAQTPVLVKADEAVPYGRVVTGAVLLQQAGATKIGFQTDPGGDERDAGGR